MAAFPWCSFNTVMADALALCRTADFNPKKNVDRRSFSPPLATECDNSPIKK